MINAKRLTEINVSLSLYTEWLARFSSFQDEEACGFVYGRIRKETAYVSSFVWVPNVSACPTRSFRISPSDIMHHLGGGKAPRDRPARSSLAGPVLLGLFHSHPRTAALPSCEDISVLRLWPELPSFWIVSLVRSAPETAVYAWAEPQESGAALGPSESEDSAGNAVKTEDTGQPGPVGPSETYTRTDRTSQRTVSAPSSNGSYQVKSLPRLRKIPLCIEAL
ncbi:Mov34/MPN/PAD-1 family protein [Paenibacillus chitinolyticus]|uniref:Mov34/MPN/PAD-1 family protein n=1 Tax=Paenibacillus chitinolyticus TaxID=79263 RepID=UPI001C469B88|nr:Mov34/MPN/PAD-1 family protein [Paenibacillus chitinolyticus]MBV6714340.1 Mov34/MPN/PAD-1 family protein [Paenibacillus chitinolyticus]